VSNCCSPKGYRWVFSEKEARREAKRYRRKGLDATSRRIVDFLMAQGVTGRTVLEVGGGIGAIQIELLKAGAARATSIELTPTYEDIAMGLVREAGLEDRVERHVMDFADAAATVSEADIVVLNRVICCYHDMPKLAGAAADHAREVLALSFPREGWWIRAGIGFMDLILRVARREFQVFYHPPNKILATCEQHGLKTVVNQPGLAWTVAAFRRAA
jgi:magnesium-protoporphyrin O-methyltransferase